MANLWSEGVEFEGEYWGAMVLAGVTGTLCAPDLFALVVALGGGQRWIEVAPPGATMTIALVPAHEGVPAGVETGIRFTTADADADHAALRTAGVDVDPEVLRWPGVPPMFAFRDQDGN